MKKILIPLILTVVGAGGGAGAGLYLRPVPTEAETPKPRITNAPLPLEPGQEAEYARMPSQFVVPVIARQDIAALVVVSLSLEVVPGGSEAVFAKEPRLRNAFLRVLFTFANEGGFEGAFTKSLPLERLRRRLLTAARDILPDMVFDVVITEIGREDK